MVIKNPCIVCRKPVAVTHRAVLCDGCDQWVHIKCDRTTPMLYEMYMEKKEFQYNCIKCLFEYLPLYEKEDGDDFSISNVHTRQRDVIENDNIIFKEDTRLLTLVFANVRSFLPKFDEISTFITKKKPKIVGMLETWLDDSTSNDIISIEGYNLIRSDRGGNCRGGGVLLYISDLIEFEELTYLSNRKTFESVWISMRLTLGEPINIGLIYRPPQTTHFLPEFRSTLEDVQALPGNTILMGDFNVDLLETSVSSTGFKNLFNEYEYIQLIDRPTRITPISETCIDHVWSNRPNLINITALANGFGDHHMITGSINLGLPKMKKFSYTARSLKKLNRDLFIKDLELLPWHNIPLHDNIDEMVEEFYKLFNETLDKHAPTITVGKRKFHKKRPWITDEIIGQIAEKNRAHTLALNKGDYQLWNHYKKLKNELNHKIKKLKSEYYKLQIDEAQKDSKMIWKTIGDLTGKKRKTNCTNVPLGLSPHQLNEYFANVGKLEKRHLEVKENTEITEDRGVSIGDHSFVFNPITENNLQDLIEKSNNSNTCGPDGIGIKILKLGMPILCKPLSYIFNFSLLTGIFPTLWKKSYISPIFKGGSKHDPVNYRPIALLPVVGKLLEKVAHGQLSTFLESRGLINDLQCGFRRTHSTTTCLIKLVNDLRIQIDGGNLSLVVSLDLSKAFDTIPHDELIQRMSRLPLSRQCINWFISYLMNRSHSVKTRDGQSDYTEALYGIPQGSVLAPLLFNIYLNPLFSVHQSSNLILFADDVTLYKSGSNMDDIIESVNSDLNEIEKWLEQNYLVLNSKKSSSIFVGTKKRIRSISTLKSIKIGEIEIPPQQTLKILGLTLDCQLTWNAHVLSICKRSMALNKLLLRLRRNLQREQLCLVFHSIIMSRINYCDLIWGSCSLQLKNRIQSIYNLAARFIVFGAGPSSATRAKVELGWISVHNLRLLHMGIMIWKIQHCGSPKYLYVLLSPLKNTHGYESRLSANDGLFIPRTKTTNGQLAFYSEAPRIWNDIPPSIRKSVSVSTFRTKFFKYLQSEKE